MLRQWISEGLVLAFSLICIEAWPPLHGLEAVVYHERKATASLRDPHICKIELCIRRYVLPWSPLCSKVEILAQLSLAEMSFQPPVHSSQPPWRKGTIKKCLYANERVNPVWTHALRRACMSEYAAHVLAVWLTKLYSCDFMRPANSHA